MAENYRYTPILGWSPTRYAVFSICKRRYFYHYYGKYDPDHPVGLILELRALVSIPLEVGGIVHAVIAALLRRLVKTQEPLDLQRLSVYSRKRTERHVRSRRFQEAYYGLTPKVEVDDVLPSVEESLQHLLESDRWGWLQHEAAESGRQWLIDPAGYGEARLGEWKVFCKADFVFPSGDGYFLIDWKTGKPEPHKHPKQLIAHASWAQCHFGAPPERIRTVIAYLNPVYQEIAGTFSEGDLEAFALQVQAETREMYAYCRDVERNIPLEKEHFPLADDTRICSPCNFRCLCFPDVYPPA